MKSGFDCKFDEGKDAWLVTVPFGQTPLFMQKAAEWLVSHWTAVLSTLNPVTNADKYAFVSKGVSAAKRGRVLQVVVSKGDVVLFDAPMGEAKKTFSIGGFNG